MFAIVLDTLGPVRVHGVLTGAMEFRRTAAKSKGERGGSDYGSPREVVGERRAVVAAEGKRTVLGSGGCAAFGVG